MENVIIGGGCFWCTEGVMNGLKGVLEVSPGYCGGHVENPTYEQVCRKKTGHAEVVKVTYDSKIINLKTILEIFFTSHDPTQLNRQGNDVGPQYRSIVFYNNEKERNIINLVIGSLNDFYDDEIVTEVVPKSKFYIAEKYHHDYYARNSSQPYCAMVISPKIIKVRKKYLDLYNIEN
ncbi:MAG: peptide-methionine (S)-S-oxide reductase [Euryarchaeota archaeon]|nr:peptide-methionine (S)-S-oxide reductase [Euryarchaeota archaeon]